MLSGFYVPNFTAFRPDNTVDFNATVEHARWLASEGVTGLVPFGTYGEGASLSISERIALVERFLEADLAVAIIPTIISNSFGDIVAFLDFLENLPITAVIVVPPSYYRPISDKYLLEFYRRVVEKTAHPVIAYNIPVYSLPISPDIAVKSGVWGVKDSSGDIDCASAYLARDVNLLIGTERLLISALGQGARGGILGYGNLFPKQMIQVYREWIAGSASEAEFILNRVLETVSQLIKPNFDFISTIGTLKSVVQLVGPTPMGAMRCPLPEFVAEDSDIKNFTRLASVIAI